jgi:hypothetical protein
MTNNSAMRGISNTYAESRVAFWNATSNHGMEHSISYPFSECSTANQIFGSDSLTQREFALEEAMG